MYFDTRVNGIPCVCHVIRYFPEEPIHHFGGGFDGSDPADPEEFEFELLDRGGRRAKWLDRYIDKALEVRLLKELREEVCVLNERMSA